jgi:hypothetical protein
MDELRRLEHLSLVSKVCTELDNHYSMNDKDLAEFIIDLAEKHPAPEDFKRALAENGAEFAESFVDNLLRIIKHMMPQKRDSKVCRFLLPVFLAVLQIRDVYPGSKFFPSRIRIFPSRSGIRIREFI